MPPRPTSHRRIAVLDMGTNSIKLLVAELNGNFPLQILSEESVSTRLGEGVHGTSRLNESAIQRTLDAACDLKVRTQHFGPLEWRAVATSAVREANNRKEFEERFQKRMGFAVRVLSGSHEAEWIYRGATSDPLLGKHDQFLVMDSGGGSAEWIRGNRTEIRERTSLNLGCVRMTECFLEGDPYTEDSYRKLLGHYYDALLPLRHHFAVKDCIMIGTGGSISSIAALELKLRNSLDPLHGHTLTLESLENLLDRLRTMTDAQRLELGEFSSKRSDIIVAGAALFSVAMRVLGATEITVSLRGLRYGILLQDNAPV